MSVMHLRYEELSDYIFPVVHCQWTILIHEFCACLICVWKVGNMLVDKCHSDVCKNNSLLCIPMIYKS
jgi:hypothetical protein